MYPSSIAAPTKALVKLLATDQLVTKSDDNLFAAYLSATIYPLRITNTDQLKMIRYPDLQHEVELKNGNISQKMLKITFCY